MAIAVKVDLRDLEREFVTGETTIRALAKKYDMSFSTLAYHARKELDEQPNWYDKKRAYKGSVDRQRYERIADRHASDMMEIHEESITVARATLRAYAQQLKDGEVKVSTKDAMLAVTVLQTLMGEPSTISEERSVAFRIPGFESEDSLRALIELARARIVPGAVAGGSRQLASGIGQD